jgi:hypothetical protein
MLYRALMLFPGAKRRFVRLQIQVREEQSVVSEAEAVFTGTGRTSDMVLSWRIVTGTVGVCLTEA